MSATALTGLTLTAAGKRFNDHWIFRNLSIDLKTSDRLAVTGDNGSGKSTFLKLISGYLAPSRGSIQWNSHVGALEADTIYHHVAIAAPYLELFDAFTLSENISIFRDLKGFRNEMTCEDVLSFMQLENASGKQLKDFSSGMKQRSKLALALCAASDLLLMDEPLSNLDSKGCEWYHQIPESLFEGRIVVIGTNRPEEEARFCNKNIRISDFH